MGGLPGDMDSTRAELMGAYAILHKTQEWRGVVRLWVDNDNVVKGLERLMGRRGAEAVWEAAEASQGEGGRDWREERENHIIGQCNAGEQSNRR